MSRKHHCRGAARASYRRARVAGLAGLSVTCLVAVAACGSGSGGASGSSGSSVLTARATSFEGDTAPQGVSLTNFANLVKKYTNGTVTFKVYNDSQLGTADEVVQELQTGSIAVAAGTSRYDSLAPAVDLLQMPFLIPSSTAADKLFSSTVVQDKIYGKLVSHGIRIIPGSTCNTGASSLLSTTPITTPTSLHGKKWRPNSEGLGGLEAQALGADPVNVSTSEIFTSLETNALQVNSDPPATDVSSKFNEAAKDLTVFPDVYSANPIGISVKFWNSLSASQKAAVDKAGAAAGAQCSRLAASAFDKAIQTMKSQGITVYKPSMAPFIAVEKPHWTKFAQKIVGSSGPALLQQMKTELGITG